jgi:hypothetical protein
MTVLGRMKGLFDGLAIAAVGGCYGSGSGSVWS